MNDDDIEVSMELQPDAPFIVPTVTGVGKVECPCGSGHSIKAINDWDMPALTCCTVCGAWIESRPDTDGPT